MIGQAGTQALKDLLELAPEPSRWRSVADLALAQSLPAPHLEQLLLRLRRAGVLEARRGRHGGYRLAVAPEEVSLSRVLLAVGGWPGGAAAGAGDGELGAGDQATERVAALLRQRLTRAIERELEQFTLAELLFDLRSARASLSEEGGLMVG